MSNAELARKLERWADNRDRCNLKPARTGRRLDSHLLREAARRLREEVNHGCIRDQRG